MASKKISKRACERQYGKGSVKCKPRNLRTLGSARQVVNVSQPATILIINENLQSLETLAEVLRLDGYIPQLASGVGDALKVLETKMPDVILFDIKWRTGREEARAFASEARKKYGSGFAPIIVISAAYTSYIASEIGAHGWIESPFEIDDLRAGIRRQLQASRETQEASKREAAHKIQERREEALRKTQQPPVEIDNGLSDPVLERLLLERPDLRDLIIDVRRDLAYSKDMALRIEAAKEVIIKRLRVPNLRLARQVASNETFAKESARVREFIENAPKRAAALQQALKEAAPGRKRL